MGMHLEFAMIVWQFCAVWRMVHLLLLKPDRLLCSSGFSRWRAPGAAEAATTKEGNAPGRFVVGGVGAGGAAGRGGPPGRSIPRHYKGGRRAVFG